MSDLLSKIKSAGSIKETSILSQSEFFNEGEDVLTKLPILNIAFSGEVDKGFQSGLSVLAGESKSFKTLLGLYSMKAYLDKHPDGIALFYDSEFGTTPEYLKQYKIDTDRVVHVPIEHIEQLKFDIVKRLEQIDKKDKVFIFIDSLGNLASKKEVEDAEAGKSVADMSRAKAIKSLFRIITPKLTTRDIPLFVIMHTYKTMDLFPKNVVSGGSGTIYSANQIFIIGKAQDKEGTDLKGYKFTINIEKSRKVREKAKLPFTVHFESGILKYSGLLDIAMALGFVTKPTVMSYRVPEIFDERNFKRKEIETSSEVWEAILENDKFKTLIKNYYTLGAVLDSDEEFENLDDVITNEVE